MLTNTVTFNFKKTKTVVFGRQKICPIALTIKNCDIEYVDEWKYLGANILSKDASEGWISFSVELGIFYSAFNSIIHGNMRLSKNALLKLLFSNCVPTLTYAAEVKQHSAGEMRSMNTAINDAIRRIFSFQRWESVRHLRESYGYDSIYTIFENHKQRFYRALKVHPNSTIKLLFLSSTE